MGTNSLVDYDSQTLKRLLPGIEFEEAIDTIESISEITEDKQMYDQREKALGDYEWAISGAREEGRVEGKLEGKIQLLQELLGDPVTPDEDLLRMSHDALTAQLVTL